MKASLIIPTYNKLPRLRLMIASIARQTADTASFEVLFIDDGSTDGTEQFFQQNSFDFTYQYMRVMNGGRAAARNKGIAAANNEILIFADDDVILHPGFIQEHIALQEQALRVVHGRIYNLSFLKFFYDPANGILYPGLDKSLKSEALLAKCITEADIGYHFKEKLETHKKITSFEQVIEGVLASQDKAAASWIAFSGGNTSVAADWVRTAGGFNDEFGRIWGCEDLELGYRLFQQGRDFYYSHDACNYHIAHYRFKYEEEHHVSLLKFYQMHPDQQILSLQEYVEGKLKAKDLVARMTSYKL